MNDEERPWEGQPDDGEKADEQSPGGSGGPRPDSFRSPLVEADLVIDLIHLPYTDTGNAERLVRLYGNDIRFCIGMGKWLAWDGRRWNSEDMRRVKMLQKK